MRDAPSGEARRRRWDTVTSRTVAVAVAAATITAFVALAVSLPLIRSAAVEQAAATLSGLADVTAAALVDPRPGSLVRLRALLDSQGVSAFAVAENLQVPSWLPDDVIVAVLQGDPVSTTVTLGDQELLVEGRPVGSGGIVLVGSHEISADALQRSVRRLLLALLLGLVAAVAVALAVSRRVTAPLRRVEIAAEQLVAGRRDVRVETQGPAEVADIADNINELAGALRVSEGRQRDFLLSVSHELRTPLTAVAGYAEALADGVVTGEEVPRTGELMVSESRRLDRLVADLLDLSRLGAADLRIEATAGDLREVLGSAAAVWQDRCQREAVRLSVEMPPDALVVVTDPDRVRQIIDNLAENALRVTPTGGLIVLALRQEPGRAVVEVRDSGPGLSEQDVADAFEPGVLYSRYQGIRPVSSGVGLALVGRLAARLGGSATAGLAPEGGACFTVRLPQHWRPTPTPTRT